MGTHVGCCNPGTCCLGVCHSNTLLVCSWTVEACDIVEHAAYYGMAAMLRGGIFNADVRDPKGRVFSWIDRMLSSKQVQA